jgi:hypothetical protein
MVSRQRDMRLGGDVVLHGQGMIGADDLHSWPKGERSD